MATWSELYWQYGDEDLQAAEVLGPTNHRLGTYLAHQAVEKWLKALQARKIDLNNQHAFEHLARDHDLNDLLERVCQIHAPLIGAQPEFLRQQAIGLVVWPVAARQLNTLRYPRFDSRTKEPSDWRIPGGAWEAVLPQVRSFRRWAEALRGL